METNINQKQVLTFKEALIYTGFSKSTLYKKTSNGDISFYKPNGKMIFFDRLELEAWLKRKRIKSNHELEIEAASYVTFKGKK